MRAGMIPTYRAARGRQPGRGKSWPCHHTGSRDPWGREWRPPCWSDRTWLKMEIGLTISQKFVFPKENSGKEKKYPPPPPPGFHSTLDPNFGLAKSYLKFSFLRDTILVASKKQSCRSCPCSTDTHLDLLWSEKTERFPSFRSHIENEPDPEPYNSFTYLLVYLKCSPPWSR